MDGKMVLYRDCFSELYEIMVNKVTFVGFRGVIAPIAPLEPAPGLQTVDSKYSGGLLSRVDWFKSIDLNHDLNQAIKIKKIN